MTTRRHFLIGTAAMLGAPAIVRAQTKEIVVGGPGGMAGLMRDEIVPAFEKRTGAKVLFEGSRSVVNLQKLQTSKDKPTMSVVMMDEDIMLRAGGEGLIAPVTPAGVKGLSKVVPVAIAKDGMWVRYKTPRVAVAFNSTRVPGGVPTWAELWDAKYRGKLAVPHMSLTSTANVLTIASHLETGKPFQEAQYDVDAGFKKLRALKPNVMAFYNNGQQGQALLEQGEAWAIPGEITSYVLLRKGEGVKIDLAAPKEGSFGIPSSVAEVKGAPNPELAREFITELLEAPAQKLFAERYFDSPANPSTPVGPGIMSPSEMFNTDWEFVSKNRAAWIERFDREVVA